MKVLAYAASNSTRSINKALATHAIEVLKEEIHLEAEVEILDLNDFEMPIYSEDREAESGVPDLAGQFLEEILTADAIIISFAEHNGSYSAAYKNIFDWMSRINYKMFKGKSLLLLATSPGGGGAANVLKLATESTPHFGGEVVASISVPKFGDNFDIETGTLTNPELAQTLRQSLKALG